jgi:hypothetical protein
MLKMKGFKMGNVKVAEIENSSVELSKDLIKKTYEKNMAERMTWPPIY